MEDKLGRVREVVREHGAEGLLVTALDDVCWLFNIRGADVACNPVVLAYAFVSEDGSGVGMVSSIILSWCASTSAGRRRKTLPWRWSTAWRQPLMSFRPSAGARA